MLNKITSKISSFLVNLFRIMGAFLILFMAVFFHCLFYISITAVIVLTYLGISNHWNKAEVKAYKNSGQVENEVKTLNPYQRCLALGGVSDECKVFMRGLDKATESK